MRLKSCGSSEIGKIRTPETSDGLHGPIRACRNSQLKEARTSQSGIVRKPFCKFPPNIQCSYSTREVRRCLPYYSPGYHQS